LDDTDDTRFHGECYAAIGGLRDILQVGSELTDTRELELLSECAFDLVWHVSRDGHSLFECAHARRLSRAVDRLVKVIRISVSLERREYLLVVGRVPLRGVPVPVSHPVHPV
jgi:hypothetical protein